MFSKRLIALTLLASALAMMPPCVLRAQWVQTNGPYGDSPYSMLTVDSTIFAAASELYYSTNAGLSWMALGDTLNLAYALFSIPPQLFAAAYNPLNNNYNRYSSSYTSIDNGHHWAQLHDTSIVISAAIGGDLFAI